MEPLHSSLREDIKRLLIDCIAGKWGSDRTSAINFLESTLFYAQTPPDDFVNIVDDSIATLLKREFIKVNEEGKYIATKLGYVLVF